MWCPAPASGGNPLIPTNEALPLDPCVLTQYLPWCCPWIFKSKGSRITHDALKWCTYKILLELSSGSCLSIVSCGHPRCNSQHGCTICFYSPFNLYKHIPALHLEGVRYNWFVNWYQHNIVKLFRNVVILEFFLEFRKKLCWREQICQGFAASLGEMWTCHEP